MSSPSSIRDAAAAFRAGTVNAVDLVNDALAAIARDQPRTNAFIRIDAGQARAAAAIADAERARGLDRGPLHGIPISLKDLIDVAGEVTTAASRVLADRVAPADATIVTRLREAGAILLGKTNLHEFALGTTSEDSAFGAVHNPIDTSRSAGGSSGGSAAAVACGMGFASIGTDTGGSIRIPSAACGVVGLKPSIADVPTDGIIPLSTSLDHAGPIARTVDDVSLVWAALANRPAPDLSPRVGRGPFRLLRLRGYFDSPVSPEVRDAFDRAMAALLRSGAVVTDAELPSARRIVEAYVNVVLPEGSAWHSRYLDTRGRDYTPMVRARFESGRAIPAVKHVEGLEFCRLLRREVTALLGDADALVLPTLPITAPMIGADEITIDPAVGDRTPVRGAMLKHTQPFNMSGHPAISLPISTGGLPAGFQLVGHLEDTAELLAIAAECEKIIGHA